MWHSFWLWVYYNSPTVQTALNAVYTLAAIAAGFFAWRAYRASLMQLRQSEQQVKFAEEQTQIARETAIAERARIEDERKEQKRVARVARAKRNAEELATLPRIEFDSAVTMVTGLARIEAKVRGLTPASNLSVFCHGECVYESLLMNNGDTFHFEVDKAELKTHGFSFAFTTTIGSRWTFKVLPFATGYMTVEESVIRCDDEENNL